jgi:hypothetical protein
VVNILQFSFHFYHMLYCCAKLHEKIETAY